MNNEEGFERSVGRLSEALRLILRTHSKELLRLELDIKRADPVNYKNDNVSLRLKRKY